MWWGAAPRTWQPGVRGSARPGHADLLGGGGHDRRRVSSRSAPAGLVGGQGKEARPVGRRFLEVVRRGKVLVVFVGAICLAVVLWVAYLLLFAG
jgi:hypothetical protein